MYSWRYCHGSFVASVGIIIINIFKFPRSNNPMSVELFYVILFFVAFLYAAVGHGGASGYLALMAIYGIAPEEMKPTALILNLFVSIISFTHYYRGDYFKYKIFILMAAASIPLAFIGGMITVEENIYKRILGVLLLFPVLRFFFFKNVEDNELKSHKVFIAIFIGGIVGLLSGMIVLVEELFFRLFCCYCIGLIKNRLQLSALHLYS